ncbi:LuxR C-terminal-related transcriptional regulator [Mycobacterium montefiorense]|uniref:LuxR family transcriptional regulator n=1 Tax=Mycobacterium montefiorense TaxID=154654 RepID=A0AA37UUV1_9MYCO|nr:LuxR C-terminal-related transcriptional regulator [Mycobacterium montefiorense]GBG40404.1 LuxR family transcriptional regulator [Mycobacterium montefiorense]GKU36497.1 LuxR family transcriptional regulator [Mycobacterium montefiorense]GKU39425.1 LuxR family transcriptional regulator [Mycobacterium montefiorense]GKU44584.1 LuxR family transcriptional regulator [Mycobacterium montefiorense]GKU53970.1 LuxR family transcriptional regulator [Mycobacterium montefiorense]
MVLATGTVTLLLAEVAGWTQLWQSHPRDMKAAVTQLDAAVPSIVGNHQGVKLAEQGIGNSFMAAFTCATDAVACALELQRAPLAPLQLRIGLHTGEVQLRNETSYVGAALNRAVRLRDLAHGGQTVLSGTVHDLVVDCLPADVWLMDLGTHHLRDLPRPERVFQLCRPGIRIQFPALRSSDSSLARQLPLQLVSFVCRGTRLSEVQELIHRSRLVTLIGVGGAGKTRLAIQAAAAAAANFADGVWFVDLGPVTEPHGVETAIARTITSPDQPRSSTIATLTNFLWGRQTLIVLDNCEHLLDACRAVVMRLLAQCPRLTIVATSREPIGFAGEIRWRVPRMSLDDEAVELFADRARDVQPDFDLSDGHREIVKDICRRLDGLPLAIELAAAQVRYMSLGEIVDGLDETFIRLDGGVRATTSRQRTLWASIDWSHRLLTGPERVLFRRLAVFRGGFTVSAAKVVGRADHEERADVTRRLSRLVDKSVVVAETIDGRTRYRLLETMRQYALDVLRDSGEYELVARRHSDYYMNMAGAFETPARCGDEQHVQQLDRDFDNLKAAFTWYCDSAEIVSALRLTSLLQPMWLARGRIQEGLRWFDAILAANLGCNQAVTQVVRARALADKAGLDAWVGAVDSTALAHEALETARRLNDPDLLVRALTACGATSGYDLDAARSYFAEALGAARSINARWRLTHVLGWQAYSALVAGDPVTMLAAAEEGRDLAHSGGDRLSARYCRWSVAVATMLKGELEPSIATLRDMADEAEAARDPLWYTIVLVNLSRGLAYSGEANGAITAARDALGTAAVMGPWYEGFAQGALAAAALSAGDIPMAGKAIAAAPQLVGTHPSMMARINAYTAQIELARGNLSAAKCKADEAISSSSGWHLAQTLTTRARIWSAQGEWSRAESDVRAALTKAVEVEAFLGVSDIIECLGAVAAHEENYRCAARLLGAANAIRERSSEERFTIYQAEYDAALAVTRSALGDADLAAALAEGDVLGVQEAIAYAQRGRGQKKRAASGWASLTPTEFEVAEHVAEGLSTKEIAALMFVSIRTIHSHLTHIYTKLGINSRVQLANLANHHIFKTESAPSL